MHPSQPALQIGRLVSRQIDNAFGQLQEPLARVHLLGVLGQFEEPLLGVVIDIDTETGTTELLVDRMAIIE